MLVPGLVERDHELRALDDAIATVRSGRGNATLLSAPPGLGKTALVSAACKAASLAELNVLRATATEDDPSYSVVRELFARAITGPEDKLLSGMGGPAAAILDPARDASVDPFAAVHALYWVLARLSDRAPVLVAIDDVHWVDQASARWISFLLARLDELPALLLMAARPGEMRDRHDLSAALGGRSDLVRLAPAPLSRRGVEALVGGPAAGRIATITAGNPFLVQVVASALRNGELSSEDLDPDRLAQIDSARLRDLVDARVGRLGPDASAVADATGILGDGASLANAAAVARLDVLRAAAGRDALVAADVLAAGTGLAFAHPLLRSAVLQNLRPADRSELHRRAAAQLALAGADSERVARQLLAVEPAGSLEVVTVLREGARAALATGAPEAAIELLERALCEPPAPKERVEVLLALAESGFAAGHSGTTGWAEAALRQTSDPVEQARIGSRAALILRLQGKVGENFRNLLPDPGTLDTVDPDLALKIRAEICAAAVATPGRRSGSLDLLRELESARPGGAGPGARAAAALLSLEHVLQGRPAAEVRRLAEVALGPGDLPLDGFPLWYATVALVHAGGAAQGHQLLDVAVTDARQRGSLVGLELATLHRAYTRLLLGDLRGAEDDVQESLDNSRPEGWEIGRAAKVGYAIRVLLQRGALGAAASLRDEWEGHDRSLPWYGSGELTWYEVFYLEGRGRLELWTGAAHDALTTFELIQHSIPNDWTGGAVFTGRAGIARALLALGRREEALVLAGEEVEHAQRSGASRVTAGADRLLGICLGGEEGAERLRDAIAGFETDGAVLDAAWARFDLGVVLRRSHQVVQARAQLAEARGWARASGALLLHERATEELAASGARPRRDATHGVDALTGRERRIADLAASGLSNPEIAQMLFVTRKTVESHLAQVYRKLGINSRHEIDAELTRDREPNRRTP